MRMAKVKRYDSKIFTAKLGNIFQKKATVHDLLWVDVASSRWVEQLAWLVIRGKLLTLKKVPQGSTLIIFIFICLTLIVVF